MTRFASVGWVCQGHDSRHAGTTITFRTPLIRIPRPMLPGDMCRVWVANALSTVDLSTLDDETSPYPGVGLEAGNPVTRDAFEELLGPGHWALDVPFRMWRDASRRWRTQGVSTCAMIALGLGRRAMVDCPDLLDGYADDIGTGLGVLISYASSRDVWQRPVDGLRPGPGCVVQVERPMHVATVLYWEDEVTAITADGGQVGRRGLQACSIKRRKWSKRADGYYLGSRKVSGWVQVDSLGYQDGEITVPEGWEGVQV